MTPYLDGGFLLTLLVRTNGSAVANQIMRGVPAPVPLNLLHQLQAENFLIALQRSAHAAEQSAGTQGQRLWKARLDETVFQVGPVDWEPAFRLALTWNRFHPQPPPPLLLLHPALALMAGATHFLAFDPRSRGAAQEAGLQLLPEKL